MRSLERSVMIIVALLVLFVPPHLHAHEFETGHIERSIDVVVRGAKVEVRYSIGLSDETIVNWLVKDGAIEAAEEQRFRKCITDYEAVASSAEGKDAGINATADSDSAATDVDTNLAQPLEFQTELAELLKEKLVSGICDQLSLIVDEEALGFSDPVVSTSPRHHVAIEITLAAKLEKKSSAKLSFIDRNFLDFDDTSSGSNPARHQAEASGERDAKKPSFQYFGNIRLACRVKGDAVQLNSNVVPVLARAKPVKLGSLDLDQRVEAATIVTKIGFVAPPQR